MNEKVVLAYSGGLDTTVIIPWLKENYNCFEISLPNIIENGKKRKILPEDADINSLPIDCKIELIKPLLFREKCNRVILNTFPLTPIIGTLIPVFDIFYSPYLSFIGLLLSITFLNSSQE